MTYIDFVDLYARDRKLPATELLKQQPKSFPLSSNERGARVLNVLQSYLRRPVGEWRVLDVGCAYGGISIEMAKAGATVCGVDVSSRFIDYARANAAGDAAVDFRVMDASALASRTQFGRGQFNVVVVNDVLEHIYDTAALCENLDYLLDRDDGVVYFAVPNGFSPRFIMSEGHRKIFGLTLLDPDCWFHLYPKRASIFYRRLAYFEALFRYSGFADCALIDLERTQDRFTAEKLRGRIDEVSKKTEGYSFPNPTIASIFQQALLKYRDEFEFDRTTHSAEHLKLKYGSYFFFGFFCRNLNSLIDLDLSAAARPFPRFTAPINRLASATAADRQA